MNLQTFIDDLVTGNGASYSLTQGKPTTGVMASMQGHEYIPELPSAYIRYKRELQREMIANHVLNFIAKNGIEAEQEDVYIGGWWSDNKLYLDLSRRFDSVQDAAEFGMLNNQKAIYSIDLDREIELPMPQGHGTETQKRDYIRIISQRIAEDNK
jgi:hypothetical protein